MPKTDNEGQSMNRWRPLRQMVLARLREFYREPEAIFWVYGFPLILAIGLGIAFASKTPQPPAVDLVDVAGFDVPTAALEEKLRADSMEVERHSAAECEQRYRLGKTALYIEP